MADENEKDPIDTDEEENLEETDAEGTDEGEESEHDDAEDSEEEDDDSEEEDDDSEEEDDDSEEDDDDSEEEDDDSAAASKKAAAAAAAAAAVAKRKKTGRKKKAPKETAGQRLAKAKKIKAERKQAERDRERDVEDEVEEAAIEQATVAASFLEKNQKPIVMGMIGIAVAAALFFGYQKFAEGATASSSAALWSAVGTANAEVVAEEDAAAVESDAPDRETYETIRARAEAALEKFRGVQSDFPGSDAATYAALGEANALYETGEFADAREVYERALNAAENDSNISVRATEGIAFTFEAEDNWDSAKERYEELKDIDHPQAEPLARLHLARVALHNDDEETAKTELRTLLENLREEDAPQLPYVRDQAELRLMALDSSLVQRAPDFGAGGGLQGAPEDLQRQIEELMRQQQEQGQ